MFAIAKWTLWQRRWSTMWWSVGVAFFIFINMALYPSFKDQAGELQKSFENLPDTAVQLFGGSTDFFSPVGFLNSQIFFIMMPLLLGILAIGLGSSILAREEQDHTIESLLARPVSRARLLAGKTMAAVAIVTIVTLISLALTIFTAIAVDIDIAIVRLTEVTFVCWLLALSFGVVALLLTSFGKVRSASMGVASVFALGGYIVSSLAGTIDWLEIPSKIFPFHYYQSEAILRGTYEWRNIIFFLVVLGIGYVIAWRIFSKRDIY